MNGKGSKIRKGANLKAYWDNYDNIFRKPVSPEDKSEENKNEKDEETEK